MTMKREGDATLVLTAWTEQVFIYSMITVGEARPCLKTLHATAQHKSERWLRRGGGIPSCHGNIICPGDIALIVTGASFTTTGEMKNSQFSISTSQPLYMNPALPFSISHPFPHLFICCSHLRKPKLYVYLLFSQRNPNTNSEKLFIVHIQPPPGVLVSQKALQIQWEISFLISSPPIFFLLKECMQMCERR